MGNQLSERAGPRFREQWREFEQLAPEAQDLVRIEFAQKLLDRVMSTKEGANPVEFFATPHIRLMVRRVLGDQAAVDLSRLIRDNRVATKSKNMMGGSPTQPRMQRQEAHDADLGILAAVENASVNGFRRWATKYTIDRMRERRNRTIANVLTTPMRNVPQVAQHIEEMRRAQARTARFAQPRRRQRGTIGTIGGQIPVAENIDADAVGEQVVNAMMPISAAYAGEGEAGPTRNALLSPPSSMPGRPRLSPEELAAMREASLRIPSGPGRTVGDDIRDREYGPQPEPSFWTSPAANALVRSLEGAMWLGLAAEATGGPPGAIIGSIGRGLRAPAAAVDQYARSARNITSTGRQRNALTDVTREGDELMKYVDELARPGEYARIAGGPRAIPEERTLANELDYFTSRRNALMQTVDDLRGRRYQEIADAPNRLMSAPRALPRAGATPRREVAFEARPEHAAERAAASRAQVRQQYQARDANAGGPRMRAQLQFDQQVDDFIGRVVASEPGSVPQAVSVFAEQSGRTVADVVGAMARRGYRIDNLPAHVYQGRNAAGQWQPLDQEARHLLEAVRAHRRGR